MLPIGSERLFEGEGPMVMVRRVSQISNEVWVFFDGHVEFGEACEQARRIHDGEIIVDEITKDIRTILQWAYTCETAPSEIHDRAARALNEPSLAHGFAAEADAAETRRYREDVLSGLDDRRQDNA